MNETVMTHSVSEHRSVGSSYQAVDLVLRRMTSVMAMAIGAAALGAAIAGVAGGIAALLLVMVGGTIAVFLRKK
jgi:hypothetical protein